MALLLEQYLPVVLEGGLNTNKAVSFGSTLQVLGSTTLAALSVTSLANSGTSTGTKAAVTPSGGSTRTLTAANSGSINLFDNIGSITYTLPAPTVGLSYQFFWTVTQTSGAHTIITDAGTTLLQGAIGMFSGEDTTPSSTLGPKMYAGNGTTHVKYTSNGTTTGGGVGTYLRFVCVDATHWYVEGQVKSPSGTIATPFST